MLRSLSYVAGGASALVGLGVVAGWVFDRGTPRMVFSGLVVATSLLIVAAVTWWNANLLHRSEAARMDAMETLNAEVDQRIIDRTTALQDGVHGHRRTEAALRLSEERLQAIVDHTSAVVTLKDLEGRYLFVNRPFASLVGEPREQLIGKRFQDVLPSSTAESAEKNDREVLAAGRPTEFEEELQLADGLHTLLVIRFPLLGSDGVPYAIGTVATDITQRKRAEGARTLLAAIVESSDDAIVSETLDGTVTSWNRGAEHVYGYSAAEMVATPIFILVPPDRPDELSALLDRIRNGETVEHYETRRQRKDGTTIDVSVTMSPLRDANGVVTGVSAVTRDITARKRAEEALAQARLDADRANQAKSEFLSRMSHELRTPLNAILGFGQLLRMDNPAGRQQERIEQILKGGRHLLDLINEVLDLARIEAGRLALSLEAVGVRATLQELLDLIHPLAAQRDCRIISEGLPRPSIHVLADLQRLKQVLLNLLSNAVKYNRKGGTVTVVCGEAADGRFRIQVIDTGIGIPADKLDQLFTPFTRLNPQDVEVEGTGLGLALSKRLTDAMGGSLGVTSTVEQGSAFWIDLPRTEPPVGRLVNQGWDTASAAPAPEGNGTTHTALYIEDNLSNVSLLEEVFALRPAIRLITAMQGRLGLDLARDHDPDLILLDLHLPDMPGIEVLRQLQETPETRSIPVVVISADATPGQIERLTDAGCRAYLTKPLDVEQLLAVLDETLHETAR